MKKTLITLALLVVASSSVSAQGCELFGGLFKRRVRTCQPVRVVRVQVVRGCTPCELPSQTAEAPKATPQATPKADKPSKSNVPPPAKKPVKTSMTEIGGCPYVTLLD